MKVLINTKVINSLKPKAQAYDVYDSKLTGLVIRVNPSGKMNYVCQYTRGRRITIGRVELITVTQARDRVTELLSDFKRGVLVKNTKTISLKKFILEHYQPWVLTHLKFSKMAVHRIISCFFDDYGHKNIDDITIESLEKWRSKRLNSGVKKETVNRDIAALKSAISKAYEWGYSESHPISKIKLLKTDPSKKIRYLTQDEELRLRNGLDQRESKLREQRNTANQWRTDRGYPLMPTISDSDYVDHLKPMILVSINTGIRQGELFQMKWKEIDFNNAQLELGGEYTKNKRTRYIPLNQEARATLKQWYSQSEHKTGFVFPSKDGRYFNNVRKSWSKLLENSDISNFRWHDLRHHFASKLVMAKVDLNTVRELLGHSDIKMTLRYAHLAPEHKAAAVAMLNVKR